MNRHLSSMALAAIAALSIAVLVSAMLARRRGVRACASEDERARHPRRPLLPWWGWLMIALAFASLSTLQAAGEKRLPQDADWVGWIGLGVVILMCGWLMITVRQRSARWGQNQSRAARPAVVSRWALVFWLSIILAYLALILFAKGPRGLGHLFLTAQASFMAISVVAMLGFVWIVLKRRFSPEARIFAQAQSGDVTGAIAAVQELMETRGRTADRLNLLGLCYQMADNHAEAREVFHEALALAGDRADLRNNIAVALLNLGYVEEAEFILSQLCDQDPTQFVYLTNYCQVLVRLGRLNAAADVFRRAENARAETVPIGKNASQLYDKMLDDCRQLLAAKADLQEGPGREL